MRARGAILLVTASVGVLLAAPALAATWVSPATTPALGELVAVDKTGESGWLYGKEDVAGDGDTFNQPERATDVRTVYAATDAGRFWVRIYVSDTGAPSNTVTGYVFVDADHSAATGGSAASTDVDPKLTTDPSMGGYEYVIGIRGNGTIAQIWEWQTTPMMQFVPLNPTSADAAAETGVDTDPIQLFDPQHGYLQAAVDLAVIGLTEACAANLFVRTVNSAATGGSDLDVGEMSSCVPADANNDGVPDAVVPPSGCTSDSQCPIGGICNNGQCILPNPCSTDADCPMDERCDMGKCVPKPGGTCDGNEDCGDLVCVNGVCNACNQTNDTCGPGRRCGPDGRCVYDDPENASGGIPLDPGDEVRGGACTCRSAGEPTGDPTLPALGLAAVVALLCFRRRSPQEVRSDR